jgi:tetratricopeptide (TPR) repeat protein
MTKPTLSFLSLLLFFNFTSIVWPQQQATTAKQELPFPGIYMKREPEGNYLGPLAALQKREADYLASEQWRGMFYDMLSYAHSYVGNYAEAIAAYDKILDKGSLKEVNSHTLDRYSPKNALDVIRSVADKEQVIMVNEQHYVPMHRAFTTQLLPMLYAKGFRYLAVEAFNERDTQLMERGYPIYQTGLYISEPIFGDMLRTALKLGFKIVPYEYQGKCQPKPDNPYFCPNERERGQAQNIYDRILRDHPDAKILVHAGPGHVQEYRSKDVTIMAAHFQEISKINPFTIDQTEMMEHSAPEYEESDYRYATLKGLIKEPTIFVSASGEFWKNKNGQFGTVDAQVFHPRVSYQSGRPRWLRMKGLREPYAVDKSLWMSRGHEASSPSSGMLLVQAFFAKEAEGAVPIDQVVISGSKQKPVLMLRQGVYRLRVIDETGKIKNEFKLVRK